MTRKGGMIMLRKINELKGFEECKGYSVSDDGKVYSHFKRHDQLWILTEEPYRELTQGTNNKGYKTVRLSCGNKKRSARVHKLVALAYISNPENLPQVDHLDGDKNNNCACNLEWVTGKENHRRKCEKGLNVVIKGKQHYSKKYKEGEHHGCVPVLQIDECNNVVAEYKSLRLAEKATGIHYTSISKVIHGSLEKAGGYKWKYKIEGSTTIERNNSK